jgi:predicted nucleic acid-binding protein
VIFIDSSALVKRYVQEAGSDAVSRVMDDDSDWAASELARLETRVAICRQGSEGGTDSEAQQRLAQDWDRFLSVPIDTACLASAQDIGCDHRVRTLDAIHLAAAMRMPGDVAFLSFDQRQVEAALKLGLQVLPTGGH